MGGAAPEENMIAVRFCVSLLALAAVVLPAATATAQSAAPPAADRAVAPPPADDPGLIEAPPPADDPGRSTAEPPSAATRRPPSRRALSGEAPVSAPQADDDDEGDHPPRPRQREDDVHWRPETARRWTTFLAGSVVFGTAWLANLTFGGFLDRQRALCIPIVGPVIAGAATTSSSERGTFVFLGIVDGAVQALGATYMVVGAYTATRKAPAGRAAAPALTLLPSVSPSFAGLSALGRF